MVKMINFITLKERVLYNLLFLNITEETHTANSALEEAVEMPSGQFHLFLQACYEGASWEKSRAQSGSLFCFPSHAAQSLCVERSAYDPSCVLPTPVASTPSTDSNLPELVKCTSHPPHALWYPWSWLHQFWSGVPNTPDSLAWRKEHWIRS